MAASTHHQVLIVGGGSAGITVAAILKRRAPVTDVAIIEPSPDHYYQPALTLVGAGVYPLARTRRAEESLIPVGVRWIHDAAKSFEPEQNTVRLKNGDALTYDYLVVCTGVKLDWGKIAGLAETLGKNAGDDFREGKATLPLILAISRTGARETEFWERVIGRKEETEADFRRARASSIRKASGARVMLIHDLPQPAPRDVRIDLRGGNVGVTQHDLHTAQIRAGEQRDLGGRPDLFNDAMNHRGEQNRLVIEAVIESALRYTRARRYRLDRRGAIAFIEK